MWILCHFMYNRFYTHGNKVRFSLRHLLRWLHIVAWLISIHVESTLCEISGMGNGKYRTVPLLPVFDTPPSDEWNKFKIMLIVPLSRVLYTKSYTYTASVQPTVDATIPWSPWLWMICTRLSGDSPALGFDLSNVDCSRSHLEIASSAVAGLSLLVYQRVSPHQWLCPNHNWRH